MRKILVTGGAGFIGSHLAEKLVNSGDFVVVLDNFDPYYDPKLKKENLANVKNKKNFRLVKGDILDTSLVENIFNKYAIDYVVHLAAKVGVRGSIKEPIEYAKVNAGGTLNLLEVIKKYKVKNFIFTSSSSVYGANKNLPLSESDPANKQLSPYAVSKKTAELYCGMYSRLYKIPITILRLFTVYGPRQRPDLAISKFARNIKEGKAIDIYGDGNAARDFVYVDDVINAILKAIINPFSFEIFNIGNSQPITINSLISHIEKKIGKKAKMKYLPFRKEDMRITYANIKKAKKLLNWEPTIDIKNGLQKTLNFLLK